MKNLKNYAMALVALVIAIGTLTFMSFKAEKSETETWYFNGGDPELASNYSKTQDPNKPCDDQLEVICSIQAPEHPSNNTIPDLASNVPSTSDTVLEQIQDAVQNMSTNETVTSFRTE